MAKLSGKKRKKIVQAVWLTVLILVLIVSIFGVQIYRRIYSPNVITGKHTPQFIYIPTGSDFSDVVNILTDQKLLVNEQSFRWTAEQMNYSGHVKPGRYQLQQGMSNKALIAMLRAGKQVPVRLTFNNIRTLDQLTARVGSQIEAKPESILHLLKDPDYMKRIGFTPENALSLFIPDTYEMYWNTSPDQFIQRMQKEWEKFWSKERLELARSIGFTPPQVSTLASIIQLESNQSDEKPDIAGVYINRLHKGMKLEADPTLVYALGDFTVNRVLSVYKLIDSPYNTYMYKGLPPGPICLPTTASVDAVLHYRKHNFLYFCAKEDFSGHHAFAATYDQHMINARKFQKALDKRGIRS